MTHTADGPGSAAPPTPHRPPERIDLPDGYLLLRRTPEHAGEMNAVIIRNLAHLRPWMSWATGAPTMEHSTEATRRGWQLWEAGSDFLYVLEHADRPGTVLGMFGLHRRVGPRAIEIGYWIDQEHTGRSLATNGAAALTEAALRLPDVDRVEIHVDAANTPSGRVPRRLGYRLDRVAQRPAEAPAETDRKEIWVQEQPACR
ncbi:GNAT family N-acetyltransferase [Kitasatospora sp. LaBMicrA B282]|uniref:GNAT family N-acetyltransferase n=1 Tax=Kitasatospora sp. LaBMicrA B282 TaxID=3420949 RepID=UPI003D0C7F9E